MSRRLEPWTEASIRAALGEFLAGWQEWPTYEQFLQAGVRDLRDAVTDIHGPEWWAREMGLAGGERRPGGVRRWTDERIRATLTPFLNGRTKWPSNREFDDAGLRAFREALRYYGGPVRWAPEMGVDWTPTARSPTGPPPKRYVPTPTRERPDTRYWTDERITVELKRFLGRRSIWPRYAEFAQADQTGLYHAVQRYGGAREWAARMNVRWVERQGRSSEHWSRERIHETLERLLTDRATWPSRDEFADQGALQLWRAVRRLGGERHWANKFGVAFAAPAAPSLARPKAPSNR